MLRFILALSGFCWPLVDSCLNYDQSLIWKTDLRKRRFFEMKHVNTASLPWWSYYHPCLALFISFFEIVKTRLVWWKEKEAWWWNEICGSQLNDVFMLERYCRVSVKVFWIQRKWLECVSFLKILCDINIGNYNKKFLFKSELRVALGRPRDIVV